jgi:hypothetical protein
MTKPQFTMSFQKPYTTQFPNVYIGKPKYHVQNTSIVCIIDIASLPSNLFS